MSRESSTVDYHHPPPNPDRWQLWRVIDILAVGCVVAALYFGFMSFVLSRKLATKTPAYVQFEQNMNAQAATRPAGTVFEWPPFTGQAYIPRPLLSLPTTYFALAFAGAGVALFVLSARRSGGPAVPDNPPPLERTGPAV
jgi:hypothetical protein